MRAENDNNLTLRELVKNNVVSLSELSFEGDYSLDMIVAGFVSIYSTATGTASSTNTSGHSWIAIRNISGSSKTLGSYSLDNGSIVSIGTWGNKGYNGVWYNLERYYKNAYTASNVFHMKVAIDSDKFSSLSLKITSNNSWSLTNNCANFARKIWNASGGVTLSASNVETPSTLVSKIKATNDYITGFDSYFTQTSNYGSYASY